MTPTTLADFLLPDGFERPASRSIIKEGRIVAEATRYAVSAAGRRGSQRGTPYASRVVRRTDEPVLLVPGFLAGDNSLLLMRRALQSQGVRTYRSHIRANVGCPREMSRALEARLESIAERRGTRVRVVGHSLGGMLARGVAARRPDLVSGLVTMGSPMLAPGAHHATLSAAVGMLVRLSRSGVAGAMSIDCVAGECARTSFTDAQADLCESVAFTALYSRNDGIVDWRACVPPAAVPVEVHASHVGMAFDPRVISAVSSALRFPGVASAAARSAVEVDRGEIA